ncbi:MAG: DUF3800 domain-containing protein [Cutibacterium granulosum]|uniref:DUF3800 domain-containing protein n=1 Tax=Cutibacterium granulosum TaxID=33011 RepID=UPI002B239604|nr:DUF3800 domain-containing protein [Cutibacterium granulosum]MEA5659257.1 DUF3800 domain-containing protein [Cutibacterium granulosum]MEA5660787.1 DUF3800 domain-containing protein [Cutibacterium granulosum]
MNMRVYVDDSGDGGFKFDKGSSRHLVMAACVFYDTEQIELLDTCMQQARDDWYAEQCKHAKPGRIPKRVGEFKHSKSSKAFRERFFRYIDPVDYAIRAIIIDKPQIYSRHLRQSPSALKAFAIRMLLTKNYDQIKDAKVFIDGQDTNAFGVSDSAYLMRMVNRESPGTISKVSLVDSRRSFGIQLADMVAGAIRSAEDNPDSKNMCANRDRLRPKTCQPRGTYWKFK